MNSTIKERTFLGSEGSCAGPCNTGLFQGEDMALKLRLDWG